MDTPHPPASKLGRSIDPSAAERSATRVVPVQETEAQAAALVLLADFRTDYLHLPCRSGRADPSEVS